MAKRIVSKLAFKEHGVKMGTGFIRLG